jgi:hypothetical protein
MAYEGLGDFNAAIETYSRASEYIDSSHFSMSFYSVQHWISKIMYRLCMLSLRLHEVMETLIHFRRYKHIVEAHFKLDYRFRETLAVHYWYWKTLSEVVKRKLELKTSKVNEETSSSEDTGYSRSQIVLMIE